MSKKTINADGVTSELFVNDGKFDSQLTKEEKAKREKELKEAENLEKQDKGFSL